MQYYDVCNDYSLDKCSKPESLEGYRTMKSHLNTVPVTLLIHIEHDELHYARSASDKLQGKYCSYR